MKVVFYKGRSIHVEEEEKLCTCPGCAQNKLRDAIRTILDQLAGVDSRKLLCPSELTIDGLEAIPKGVQPSYCLVRLCKRMEEKHIRFKDRCAKYRISTDDVISILDMQDDACPICGKTITLETAHIDHDHKSGKVRGLLCSQCNLGIGLLHDNSEVLNRAAAYIRSH